MHKLPFDPVSSAWLTAFGCMQHRKIERRIAALFADRWQHLDAPELQLQGGAGELAVTIAYLDSMYSLAARLGHLCGYGMGAITGKAVDAGTQ